MMARLYANENFPLQVVNELRRLGHEVLTSQEAGNAGQGIPDDEVLNFARVNNRVLLTLNRRHFVRLHQQQPAHEGIIVCTFDPNFANLAARIDTALRSCAELSGELIRINRPITGN
jgi:predicted nuclease of predicted toxin-antitoxin system